MASTPAPKLKFGTIRRGLNSGNQRWYRLPPQSASRGWVSQPRNTVGEETRGREGASLEYHDVEEEESEKVQLQ